MSGEQDARLTFRRDCPIPLTMWVAKGAIVLPDRSRLAGKRFVGGFRRSPQIGGARGTTS